MKKSLTDGRISHHEACWNLLPWGNSSMPQSLGRAASSCVYLRCLLNIRTWNFLKNAPAGCWSAHWAKLQIGNAHEPENSLSCPGNGSAVQPAAAAASELLWLRNCSRQVWDSRIPAASDCQNPFCGASEPGQPAGRQGFKWPGKKIWLHWNPASFSPAEPGFHGWQLPSCCLYGIVFLLKSVDLGWEEAVSPGIVFVT